MSAIVTWLAFAAVLAFIGLVVWRLVRDSPPARIEISDLSPAPDEAGDVLINPGQTLSGTVTATATHEIALENLVVAIRLNTHERAEHALSDELGRIETHIARDRTLASGEKLSVPFALTFPSQHPLHPGLALDIDGGLPGLRTRSAPRAGAGDFERHIYWTLEARAEFESHDSTASVDLLPVED